MNKKIASEIYGILSKASPGSTTALEYQKPHELLIATILSAQCTDKRVNMVTPELFKKYPTIEKIAAAGQRDIERIIRSTGFYRSKARHIIGSARKIEKSFGGKVPGTMKELVSLPGVARKTANIVLYHGFGKIEGIAVDTHVKRVSGRIGFTGNADPVRVEKDLMKIFDRDKWGDLTNVLISHGRKVCRAIRPLCGECPVSGKCLFAKGRKISGRLGALLLLVLTLFSLVSCAEGSFERLSGKKQMARYVIDGDTVELFSGERIRYTGIDAPETRLKQGAEWVFSPEMLAVEAKERNEELVRGKELSLEFDQDIKDKYGRYLAYVYADGEMVNLKLIEEGLASVYTFPPNVRYYKALNEAQQKAVASGRGIWGRAPKIKADEASAYSGSYCFIRDRITGAEVSPGRLSLMFGEGKEKLRIIIPSRNLRFFYDEAVDPLNGYNGKTVEVFGKVQKTLSGTEMIIDNPFQIKVLKE